MEHVGATMDGPRANDNSVIAFHDNSSAIKGFRCKALQPSKPGNPCEMTEVEGMRPTIVIPDRVSLFRV
jgi:hypothetical protein